MPISYRQNSFIQLLIMLFLTELARGMFILSYLPGMPAVSTHVTITIVSVAVTLHFVTDAVTNMFIGGIMKRFGAKKILAISYALGFISFSLVLINESNVFYIIAAIMLGIAACPIWIITLSSIREDIRGKQMGIVYFIWMSGLLSGMVVMNILITIEARRFVIIFPIIFLVNFIILMFTKISVVVDKTTGWKRQFTNMAIVMRAHIPVLPGIVLQALAVGMLIPILPSFIVREAGLLLTHYTIILAVAGGICSIAIVSIGKVLDTFKFVVTQSIIVVGFIIFGVSILFISGASGFFPIMGIALVLGLIYGVLLPSWNKFMARRIHGQLKEETWGFFNFVQGIGTMLGPLLGGLLVGLTGEILTTIYVTGIIFIALALFYIIYFVVDRSNRSKSHG